MKLSSTLLLAFLFIPFAGMQADSATLSCVATKEPLQFYEKVAEINSQLYKIAAKDLQTFLGCSYTHIPSISAYDLEKSMSSMTHLRVLNVLPKILFDDCHIQGSESVPLKELVDRVADWPRDQPIVVYCALSACDAGKKAYVLLSCMGFTNVVDYEGGIKEWYQLGYSVGGPASYSYLHVKYAQIPHELFSESCEVCGIVLSQEDC